MIIPQSPSPIVDPRGYDFTQNPMLVYWEMTQACMLACRHCRAEAMPSPHPLELTPTESMASRKALSRTANRQIILPTLSRLWTRQVTEVTSAAAWVTLRHRSLKAGFCIEG